MNKQTKYAIGAAVALVAIVFLTKSIVSTLVTVAIVGAVAAGSYWAYNKYKDFKGKEYLSSMVKKATSPVSANSPSKKSHREGRFEFVPRSRLDALPLPSTDREQIWPLFWKHRGGFFSAHCVCHADGSTTWTIEESRPVIPPQSAIAIPL